MKYETENDEGKVELLTSSAVLFVFCRVDAENFCIATPASNLRV